MAILKCGIIGCGPRSYVHAAATKQSGVLQVAYACDIRSDRLEQAAATWDTERAADYRTILDDAAIDAVIIATDVGNHLSIARDALRAGKHIICEKPLGDDVAQARELVQLSESVDRVAYVSFQLRFMPKLEAVHGMSAAIDPVQILFGRSRGMMKPQFLNPTTFCGIMDVCAHDFDQVVWLMGCAPEAVTAVVRRNTFTRDTGATDVISALIDFGDGRSASVVSSIGANEVGSKWDIVGACGNMTVAADGGFSGVTFERFDSSGDKARAELDLPKGPGLDARLQQAFVKEITEGVRSHAARLRDGLNSLLLTVACLKSMDEQRRVRLSEMT